MQSDIIKPFDWQAVIRRAENVTELKLVTAMRDYCLNPYYPWAIAKQINEVEFVFCDEDASSSMAVDVEACYVDAGLAVNFVVWEAGEPARWWRFDASRTSVFNWPALDLALRLKREIRLVWTPQECRDAFDECVCILDWSADIRRIFGDLAVVCDDPALEREYARAWRGRKWGPRVKSR